jgi:hypothetical protein
MFLSPLHEAQQLYYTEAMQLAGHPVTSAVLRTVTEKHTAYSGESFLFSFNSESH